VFEFQEYLATNESLNELGNASEAGRMDASRLLAEAQELLREAQSLEANATRISPQDIISESLHIHVLLSWYTKDKSIT